MSPGTHLAPINDCSLEKQRALVGALPMTWVQWQSLSPSWHVSMDHLHAAACFIAMSMSFLVYGVLQERVMTVGFGPQQELFRWSLFVVFCNRLVTCTVAIMTTILQKKPLWPVAPMTAYAAVSLGNLVASTCQYDSLKYVSFAVQTLAKCCKMIPVMLWGLLLGTSYSFTEVGTAASILFGCISFICSGNILSDVVDDPHAYRYYGVGLLQLALYLSFDGFASTWQDKLFLGYNNMDTSNQVLYTTLCSTLFSVVLLSSSNDMQEALSFLKRHPEAWVYILTVSSVATLIQYFVSYTIKTYGALNFATLMTARQFFSILASCWIFEHTFTSGQWLGTLVVFTTLSYRMLMKQRSKAMERRTPRGGTNKAPLSPPANGNSISSLVGLGLGPQLSTLPHRATDLCHRETGSPSSEVGMPMDGGQGAPAGGMSLTLHSQKPTPVKAFPFQLTRNPSASVPV